MIFSAISSSIHGMQLFFKKVYTGKQPKRILIKLLIAIFFAWILGNIFLRKIYEVPVNYTEFDLHGYSNFDVDTSTIDIVIKKNFDRNRHVSVQKQDSGYVVKNNISKFGGYISISGIVKLGKTNTLSVTNKRRDYDFKSLDSIPDDVGCSHVIYSSINCTRRQRLLPFKNQSVESKNLYVDTLFYVPDQEYEYQMNHFIDISDKSARPSYWNIHMNYLMRPYRKKSNSHEYCYEAAHFASIKDSICPIYALYSDRDFESPNIFTTLEDISKAVEIVNLPITSYNISSLLIDYTGTAEFSYIYPEPDEMTISSIRYKDPQKIKYIQWHGLKYHVNFPDMENLQDIRIMVITILITLLLTYIISLIYNLIHPIILSLWKNYPKSFLIIVLVILLIIYSLSRFVEDAATIGIENLEF